MFETEKFLRDRNYNEEHFPLIIRDLISRGRQTALHKRKMWQLLKVIKNFLNVSSLLIQES